MCSRRLPLLFLAAALAAAATAAEPPTSPPLSIEVVEEPATDSWRVTYRFAEPVAGVVFQRRRRPPREESWRLASGLSWGAEGDLESVLVEGAPAPELTLEIDSDFRTLVKQYELNVPYTDGGRLFHTGQLSVRPLGAERAPDHRWLLRTAPGRNIVVLDHHGEGSLEWLEPGPSTGNSTYAYFGPQAPERRDRMSYLADPGLPEWMRLQVDGLLPRLFDRFAKITGFELDFRPLVLLSYRPADTSGLTFLGGTLDGLVQIAAEGRAWERQSPDAEWLWLDRTAHEVFHFWTGEMFATQLGGDEDWLTEGGADYYALRSTVELGVLDEVAYRRETVERANDCLVGLAGQPILGASERQDFQRLYTCGSTLWLWAAAAGRSATEPPDEHAFVRRLLARADQAGRELTTYRFLEALHDLTGSAVAGAPLARLLFHGSPKAADELFAARMRAAGVAVELVSPAEATLDPQTRLPEVDSASWTRLLRLVESRPPGASASPDSR